MRLVRSRGWVPDSSASQASATLQSHANWDTNEDLVSGQPANSFVVVGERAYTTDADGTLVSVPFTATLDLSDASENVIGVDFAKDPSMARSAALAVQELRSLFAPSAAATPSSTDTSGDAPAAA